MDDKPAAAWEARARERSGVTLLRTLHSQPGLRAPGGPPLKGGDEAGPLDEGRRNDGDPEQHPGMTAPYWPSPNSKPHSTQIISPPPQPFCH